MPTYIAESYLARARHSELSALTERARDAALALAAQGQEVAYLRCAFVPEDEVCLLWLIAPSLGAIGEVERLAKLEFDRIVEELEPPPQEEKCAHEPA